MPILFAIIILLIPSNLWVSIGVPFNLLYLLSASIVIVGAILSNKEIRVPLSLYWLIAFFGAGTFMGAIYWSGDIKFAIPYIVAVPTLLSCFAIDREQCVRTADISTKMLGALLLTTWLSFFWALAGGEPWYESTNIDGRSSAIFGLSFTNYWLTVGGSNIIRPAGLYDEPGTYAFIICAVVFLREAVGLSPRVSWRLLLGGLVTTSLALIIFMGLYYIHRSKRRVKILVVLGISVVALFSAAQLGLDKHLDDDGATKNLYNLTIGRLAFQEGKVSGDNRSELADRALELIPTSNILFGLDSTCVASRDICQQKYGAFGENPFAPYLWGGLLGLSGAFYLALLVLLAVTYQAGAIWLGLAVFLLFLQRPNFVLIPIYSVPIYIALRSFIKKSKENHLN